MKEGPVNAQVKEELAQLSSDVLSTLPKSKKVEFWISQSQDYCQLARHGLRDAERGHKALALMGVKET